MKKILPTLFLTSFLAVLVVPAAALAAACPQVCGSHTDLCTCGTTGNTVGGEFCCGNCITNSGRGKSFVSQTECLDAQAAAAQGSTATGGEETAPTIVTSAADLVAKITTIGNWIFTILIVVAGIFLIISGFMFITAGGNPENVTKARQYLINALIGVAVALAAKGLVLVIRNILGG